MEREYYKDYAVLGVAPHCTWSQLKSTYRRRVRALHPDQRGGQNEDPVAEEILKEVNRAFDRLSRFYRAHGRLPGNDPRQRRAGTVTNESNQVPPRSPSRARAEARVDEEPAAPSPPGTFGPQGRTIAIAGVATLAAALYVTLQHVALSPQEHVSSSAQPTGAPSKQTPSTGTVEQKPTRQGATPSYFTVGSSMGEVFAVQGAPTATEGNVWHYGPSKVVFERGRVHAWQEDPASPLSAHPFPEGRPSTAKSFTVGSPKSDVRAAQGPPLTEGDTVWDYGLSKVYFREGKVVGWDESPMRPLKIRR